MSTKAQAILEEIQALPPEEQEQVLDNALRLHERAVALAQNRQREALSGLRGISRGKGLLERLLAERAKERIRG